MSAKDQKTTILGSSYQKCPECGRFMRKECESDDPENLEDEVVQWWSCKQHGMYPEHLYFKSQFKWED